MSTEMKRRKERKLKKLAGGGGGGVVGGREGGGVGGGGSLTLETLSAPREVECVRVKVTGCSSRDVEAEIMPELLGFFLGGGCSPPTQPTPLCDSLCVRASWVVCPCSLSMVILL